MVPVSPEVTEAVVGALKDKIFNALQEKELDESKRDEMKVAIDKMFTQFTPDKLNSINDGATVHAEAALMGIAYAIANQERKADGTEWHIDGLPVCGPFALREPYLNERVVARYRDSSHWGQQKMLLLLC